MTMSKFLSVCLCAAASLLVGCQGNGALDSILSSGFIGQVGRSVGLPVADLQQVRGAVNLAGTVVDNIPAATDDADLLQSITDNSGVVQDPPAAMAANRAGARQLVENAMRAQREASD